MHFFSENFPFSISSPHPPLSKLNLLAESAIFRSNIDPGGGGTSLCANVTLQSVENRAISEHLSYFEAVARTFVQDCRMPHEQDERPCGASALLEASDADLRPSL